MLLRTIAKMRLYASNDGSTGIDTIPSDVIFAIKEIQLRHNSSSVYYVRVESIDGKYKGWVSLGSSHYDLYSWNGIVSKTITSMDGDCTYEF